LGGGGTVALSFKQLEEAFEFVSSSADYESAAYVRRSTGEIFYSSDVVGINELPDDWQSHSDDFLEIPHKHELDLGQSVVWRFVESTLPEHRGAVESFFRGAGAYARYKEFLEGIGLLDQWYEFEEQESRSALLDWCRDMSLPVTDATS
jgi:hypothetical protein